MADTLRLQVITPQKEVLNLQTPWVVLPGTEGELGILPQHIGIVTTLTSGVLRFGEDTRTAGIAVHYGYAQVHDDRVVVLAEMAEKPGEVDVNRAADSERRARAELAKASGDQADATRKKQEGKLLRAQVRQQLASLARN